MQCTSAHIKSPVHQCSQGCTCYHDSSMASPNKLAKDQARFDQGFCTVPTCHDCRRFLVHFFMLHLTSHIQCNTLLMAAPKPALSETSSITWRQSRKEQIQAGYSRALLDPS